MKINNNISRKQTGFTIVELMIALSVFTTILLLSSLVLIRLGAVFTKGNNQADTQNAARNLVDSIGAELEFSGADPIYFGPSGPNQPSVRCFGTTRYTYMINHLSSGTAIDHVLWRDSITSSGSCQANQRFLLDSKPEDLISVAGSGSEVMPRKMRITQFDITDNANSFTVSITVAYGDDDLIFDDAGKTRCKSTTGSQYCSVAALSRTVSRRIGN